MNNENLLQKILEAIEEQNKDNRQSVYGQLWTQTVPTVIMKRELQRSADYVEKNMPDVTHFTSGYKPYLYNYIPSRLTLEGHVAEFGVWKGDSINYLATLFDPKIIWGFDSFFGLEEDFSIDHLRGGFNENGNIPVVKDNVSLVVGSFSESLPIWLKQHPGVFSFINIDCDTYQATSTVLNLIGPERIVSGTVILFDEYLGFAGWKNHEFKAWQEYCNKNNVKYKYIAINNLQVLLQVL
jgi:hypothetical protein